MSDWGAYDASPVTEATPLDNLFEINAAARGGVNFDTLILNEIDVLAYYRALGRARLLDMADVPGFTEQVVPRVINMGQHIAAGTGYYVNSGQLGSMRLEQALRSVTYRDEATDRTWMQSGVRPAVLHRRPGAGRQADHPRLRRRRGLGHAGHRLRPPGGRQPRNLIHGSARMARRGWLVHTNALPPHLAALSRRPHLSLVQGGEPSGSESVPDGTVQTVLDWVGGDPGRARSALDKERGSADPRSTLIEQLESIAQ